MDNVLHKQYKDVAFTPEQVSMFADLVMSDDAIQKTFLKIGEVSQQAAKEEDEAVVGVTIPDIVRTVKINRKVQTKRGGSFEEKYTFMNYKHAERVVANLLMMTLCYARPFANTKLINYTHRGKQVAAELIKRLRKKEKEGMIQNGVHE